MFSTYLTLTALPLTLVHGLTISNPTETVTSTGPITISWQTSSGDPSVFSIELINQSFNSQYTIANNVDSSLGSLSLTLPRSLPSAHGYTIELMNISNINDIYAQTGTFSVSRRQRGLPVKAVVSASGSGSASVTGSSTRASSTSPFTSSAASTATTSAFNAASRVQVRGVGMLAVIWAWVVAISNLKRHFLFGRDVCYEARA
ncbi:hypothetical protein ARMGADRAFT_1105122 [Armillaria gallica]|uniref:Yeast cell wall synthesis Kre9/Knh1-like N-terminal domain-containing protein n=1 Tax=Armillaria gallica TaxID=47427 RepID=A0A2H3DAV0_ARMGA|nr:hypothetical protein ARMGADRAFT_1105122 [Armillaria gallica]